MSQELKHSFTVDDHELMGRTGVLRPDRRTELLEGVIYDLAPIGVVHAACVDYLITMLNCMSGGKFIVRGQNPIRLNGTSEPQPDLALLRWRDDFYRNVHPTPADVLLVFEVADRSLDFDRRTKLPLYAGAGIPEIWVVNLPAEQVEVHAELGEGSYRLTQIYSRGQTVQSRSVAEVSVAVTDIFG